MAFAISEFKSNLRGGGAKASLFQVELNYPSVVSSPTTSARFLISGASIPASTISTYDLFYHGKAIKVASDKSYETWQTTIINDEDFGVRKAIEQWMELLANKDLTTRSSFGGTKKEGNIADYKQDLIVDQYSESGKIIQTYKFLGAFPTALSSIELGWENPVMQTYTCTWTYDCWEHGGSLSTDPRNLQFALDG